MPKIRIRPHVYGAGADRNLFPMWEQGGRTNHELPHGLRVAQMIRVANTCGKATQERASVTFAQPGTRVLPGPGEPWGPAVLAETDLCVVPARWRNLGAHVRSDTRAGINSGHSPIEIAPRLS